MDSTIDPELHRRNFRTVFGLGGLFLLPLVLSFWLYYGLHWRPLGTTNHGDLITPLRPLPDLTLPGVDGSARSHPFHGKWTLVYVGDGACDASSAINPGCSPARYARSQQPEVASSTRCTRVISMLSDSRV